MEERVQDEHCPSVPTLSVTCPAHRLARDSLELLCHLQLSACHCCFLRICCASFLPSLASAFSRAEPRWLMGVRWFFRQEERIFLWLTQRKNWKGTRAYPATRLAWQPHGIFFPIPPSRELGSYFIIWSGTGLFLNLGCSSKTGWTVKHWMSGIPAVKGSHTMLSTAGTVPNIAGPR